MSITPPLVDARPQPSKMYRWQVLVFVSVAMFGNYYIYDSINPLERIFLQQLNFSASMFGWLNASYSVAAVATLLIGGILIDRFGIKKSLLFFSVLILLGALLTSLSGNFYLMVAGRAVVGLGAESQIVAVTTALARWFKGKELSFGTDAQVQSATRRIEFFWLCEQCAPTMTLVFEKGMGVVPSPLLRAKAAAAATLGRSVRLVG